MVRKDTDAHTLMEMDADGKRGNYIQLLGTTSVVILKAFL